MTFTLKQNKEAYSKLSPEVQDFIIDNDTVELIAEYLKNLGLNDEQYNLADSEILYAMYGLQSPSDTINNIAKISNKNISELSKLKMDLDENIFSKIVELSTSKNKSDVEGIKIDKNAENRINEVAKKYSLNENQTSRLKDVLGIMENDSNNSNILLENIISNLSVSRLIAEQIIEDLNRRVLSQPQITKPVNSAPKPIVSANKSLPEIRPDNVPMVEDDKVSVPRFMPAGLSPKIEPDVVSAQKPEALHFTTVPKIEPQTELVKSTQGTDPLSRINFAKNDSVSPVVKEPEQKPAFIPKFGSASFNDPLAQQVKSGTQSVIDSKMNGVTGSQMEKPKPVAPVHEYVVDPYREPLV